RAERERRAAAAGHLADVDAHVRHVGGQRHGLARAAEVETAAREVDRAGADGKAAALAGLRDGLEAQEARTGRGEAAALRDRGGRRGGGRHRRGGRGGRGGGRRCEGQQRRAGRRRHRRAGRRHRRGRRRNGRGGRRHRRGRGRHRRGRGRDGRGGRRDGGGSRRDGGG